MQDLFIIEILAGSIVILCSLATSLYIRTKKNIPDYIQIFYLYPLSALFISFTTLTHELVFKMPKSNYNILVNLYFVIHLIFWYSFFTRYFGPGKRKLLVKRIFFITSLSVLTVIITTKFEFTNYKLGAVCNLNFVLYCLIYFISLFKNEPIYKISKEPSFWIITGLFFYSTFSLPLFPIFDYFRNNGLTQLSLTIVMVINLLIIIMHLFFIKGCLCLTRQHKAYLSLS